ncbi:hypothetical protein ARMSODRAFT_918191 [Armillaria solidipes]|uniref:C3H1-type domain-containing protein n=1 Tax=Armillaria solidipes TaxID=1076256 RepID=A0A2H3BLH1_9AGAR|nr:hypothetical protein ARMSODRAFT_918191 [Armillaria solidipes]
MTTTRPSVLVLALLQERVLYPNFAQLMESMAICATVTQVETKGEFARIMKLSPPTVVVAIDAGISRPDNAIILSQLLQYTREGGITICCCNFSNHIDPATARSFFAAWGLPWGLGSYFRTTVQLNRAATGVSLEGLPESYSLKALSLLNVARKHRMYAPSLSSRVESKVFGPNEIPVDINETPCAYGPVGRGWFGYVGDVNNEDGSTQVVMAMARSLPQSAVVPDRTDRTAGFSISLNGRPAETQPMDDPDQIVMFTDTIRKAGEIDFISGHRMGRAREQIRGVPVPQPSASSSSSRTHTDNPPRPREDEVRARAVERTEKSKQGDAYKEQGNKYFSQGKYQEAIEQYKKAIDVHGPQPIYNTNIAVAYLKLHMCQEAEEYCDEALKYDPRSIKARYRRGIARRDMFAFKSAMEDFRACVKLAPHDSQFKKEIAQTRQECDQRRAAGIPDQYEEEGCDPQYIDDDDDDDDDDDSFDPPLNYPGKPLQSDPDKHEGNGQPCRAYNHDGCSQGSKCRFRHSPEDHTTRDELGRNVCNFWLADACTSGSQCAYSHSKEYLPENGWWNEKGSDDMKSIMRDLSRIRNMTPGEQREFDCRYEMGLPPLGYDSYDDDDDDY